MKNFKKKMVAVVTAMMLTILTASSFLISAVATSVDNNSLRYVKYNAKTNEFLGSYTLNKVSATNNSRVVIPPDTRVIDWTKSGVVKIEFEGGHGSGFVVGEHIIATAGHCAADRRITDILLFGSGGTLLMRATPVEKHFLLAFDDEYTVDNDYALITVKEDLSNYMCFNLASPVGNILERAVSVTGFPSEYNDANTHNMYTGQGIIISMDDYGIRHSADTSGGNSGGPIYMTESYNGQQYNSVIGISTSGGSTGNIGKRMTFDLLHFYCNNNHINY